MVVLLCDVAAAQPPVNPGFIRKTVDNLGAVIAREHFDPNTGSRVQTLLRERVQAGHYDRETSLDAIAKALIAAGRESESLEAKPGGLRTDQMLGARVVRGALGMANHEGGGFIVIGIEELANGTFAEHPCLPRVPSACAM